ncbi:MAG: DUF5131 family protein, partial [Parabacteroides sp.]|nr:DUF5131 family protein [Parabacteroides sp.]
ISQVFEVMNHASQHTFQVLTKRAERMNDLASSLNWTPNIWQGVTVESGQYKYRMNYLRKVPAKIRFVSFEPLIDEVKNIDFSGIDWAIVGGESGFRARTMQQEWILSIKDQCESQGTLFYFKQWGGVNKKKAGRVLLGQTWDAMPGLRI